MSRVWSRARARVWPLALVDSRSTVQVLTSSTVVPLEMDGTSRCTRATGAAMWTEDRSARDPRRRWHRNWTTVALRGLTALPRGGNDGNTVSTADTRVELRVDLLTGREPARSRTGPDRAVARPPWAARALLTDGSPTLFRLLGPDDVDEVLALHTSLNEQDQYLRFSTIHPADLDDYVRRTLDPHGGAVSLGARVRGRLVGLVQLLPTGGDVGEVAAVVERASRGRAWPPCSSSTSPTWPCGWGSAAWSPRSSVRTAG